ncbi:MAG: hydroxymethylbilane synthase [Verrucomicrobia bacterium]|nr:hydroxymethylbilane synthase [Verrucomicrobiota bacterium]
MKRVVLGTRGSQLALAQAELVKQALERLPETSQIIVRIVRTTGDRRLDISLSKPGPKLGKGLFTKELEEALLSREIDVAVHSLKDLPTELAPGLELTATLPRHDPVDVLISKSAKSLREIPAGGVVATSSPRRARQIAVHRPDLRVANIRGNVSTRLAKLLAEDSWNSLVLAKAGLARLGYGLTTGLLEFESGQLFVTDLVEILPAAGQGAIGLEIRANESELHHFLANINDASTWFCTGVEREFLRLLGGGCNLPLGLRTWLKGNELRCEAIIFDASDEPRFGTVSGEFKTPRAAAAALFNRIYDERK